MNERCGYCSRDSRGRDPAAVESVVCVSFIRIRRPYDACYQSEVARARKVLGSVVFETAGDAITVSILVTAVRRIQNYRRKSERNNATVQRVVCLFIKFFSCDKCHVVSPRLISTCNLIHPVANAKLLHTSEIGSHPVAGLGSSLTVFSSFHSTTTSGGGGGGGVLTAHK